MLEVLSGYERAAHCCGFWFVFKGLCTNDRDYLIEQLTEERRV